MAFPGRNFFLSAVPSCTCGFVTLRVLGVSSAFPVPVPLRSSFKGWLFRFWFRICSGFYGLLKILICIKIICQLKTKS